MSPRNMFRIGVAVAALGWLGWNWYRTHHAADASGKPTTAKVAAAAPPAKPRMYGGIAFHPCTLAPQYGAMSVPCIVITRADGTQRVEFGKKSIPQMLELVGA